MTKKSKGVATTNAVAYDANKAKAAFSGKLYGGTAEVKKDGGTCEVSIMTVQPHGKSSR